MVTYYGTCFVGNSNVLIFSDLDLPSTHPNWEDGNIKSEKLVSGLKSLNGHQLAWKITFQQKNITYMVKE